MSTDQWSYWALGLPHIITGVLALGAGAVALSATKGGRVHRKSGMLFVYMMLVMSAAGAIMAYCKPVVISVIAGTLTFYLVVTSVLTVRPVARHARLISIVAMLVAFVVGGFGIMYGVAALNSGKGSLHGYPAAAYLIFGAVALIGAALDLRLLLVGAVQGHHRLARHLWRMCFAMYIATSAFFLGQAKLLPEPWRNMMVLSIPVIVVFGAMVFWLLRVLFSKRYRRT